MIWVWFPDTLGIPLEEVAGIFGDKDEIYQAEIEAEKAVGIVNSGSPAMNMGESEEEAEKGEPGR